MALEFIKLFEEAAPPLVESFRAWLSPEGKMLPIEAPTHEQDAWNKLGKGASMESASVKLYGYGWLRVVSYGSNAIMANTEDGKGITPRQKKELIDTAIEQGVTHVLFDNGNSYRTIWVDEEKMLSESGS